MTNLFMLGSSAFALGRDQLARGRFAEAIESLQAAIAGDPDYWPARFYLSVAYRKSGDMERAAMCLETLVALAPDVAEAHLNLGTLYRRLGRAGAEACFRRALELDPKMAEAYSNLANTLRDAHRYAEALELHERAVREAPANADLWSNYGNLLRELGEPGRALSAYDEALRIDPNHAPAHAHRAYCWLLQGDARGFLEYEWRFAAGQARRPHAQPRWDGTPTEESVLVWGEQGVGDEVMFGQLWPQLRERCAHVVWECDARLCGLFQRAWPDLLVEPRQDPPTPSCQRASWQIPAASLARWFVPDGTPFLRALPDRMEIGRHVGAPTVGIAWHSGNAQVGHLRSAPLPLWRDILSISRVRFVSLQYGDTRADQDAFGDRVRFDPSVDPLTDMEAFAAQVAAMDLVVSIDNSTVHVAGALGVPVWTLLDASNDWRWGRQGERTAWYQSMRLWRQPARDDWASVFTSVRAAMHQLFEGPGPER